MRDRPTRREPAARTPPPPTARAPGPPKKRAPETAFDPRVDAGDVLFTMREGYENDLVEEISRTKGTQPRRIAPALVAATWPPGSDPPAFTFARQSFRVSQVVRAKSGNELLAPVTAALRTVVLAHGERPWALHAFVPDSTDGNRFARSADTLGRAVEQRAPSLDSRWADRRSESAHAVLRADGTLAHVCLLDPVTAIVGATPARLAPSLHPGGRARMRVSNDAPSRAAMKLEEAFDWLGFGPAAGEVCVDLGAAPGGWTYVMMDRGVRVVAVDPGAMAPSLASRRGLEHVCGSAFDYEPEQSVDWLLCDMVWRPLEVSALLARWAKRRWSRLVVANIKLAMKQKLAMLDRVRATMEQGGWEGVRFRQLYHDRDEVTLVAHRER